MRLSHVLRPELFEQFGNTQEPCTYVRRERVNFGFGFFRKFYVSTHTLL
jgi:hypothetical protein